MNKMICRWMTAGLSLVSLAAYAQQSELQQYVQQCQTQLGFNASDLTAMNCNEGERFAFGGRTPINDFVTHRRVNDSVDALAACRWGDDGGNKQNTKFKSIELLIHNRFNMQTCFFSAKDRPLATGDPLKPVPSAIVSPTNFGAHPNADDFWIQPTELNNKSLRSDKNTELGPIFTDPVRCVGCHSQGAIIASKDVVTYLGQFGVINNRHQTLVDMNAFQHYHAVGASGYQNKPVIPAFQDWDATIAGNITNFDCSGACHSLASASQTGNLFPLDNNTKILPSIIFDMNLLIGGGFMEPSSEDSDWKWINLDVPGSGAGGVESENFADAKDPSVAPPIPGLLANCAAPYNLEAHAVGVHGDNAFSTSEMAVIPDRLKFFNAKEGLVCMNGDQNAGQQCHDYAVSYLCDDQWVGPFNTDAPTFDGDHEERSRVTGLCAAPKAIKATFTVDGVTWEVHGPNDRLARFSPYGLACNNADQPSGQCSNYVVRYRACGPPLPIVNRHLTSIWSGMQLTATSSANNAQTRGQPLTAAWNTQQWALEPVTNTEYVRLKNTGTNTYLNVTSQAEQATVVSSTSSTATSQQWIVEPVKGNTDFRLKNLWSGRYLTIADTSNFSAIYSQAINPGWASQRWVIQ